jgi:tRNA dimethylallyltransferase
MDERPHALIVAGPTCSGKSALALGLAQTLGGVVINADSMQVYRELRIITARPTVAEEALAPHALYGVRPAAEPGSAAWWRAAALAEMSEATRAGRLPILCGGTGMYLSALTAGIAEIPDPGEAARAEARAQLAEFGPAALHAALARVDPATAARQRPGDSQRLARAWEVWRGTGRGLAAWQAQTAEPAPWRFTVIRLDPPRPELRAAIAGRFTAMLAQGALQEVRDLLALHLDPALPAMRAHGVPELAAHLRGEITLQEAARRAELATGQYTKRQATWFRHRPLADQARTHVIHARIAGLEQFSERKLADLISFIQFRVDAPQRGGLGVPP